jgi:long-subunit acyl-CoA synthetase (AMP-forming)
MSGTLIGIFLETVEKHDRSAQFIRKTPRGWEPISAQQALADVESLALGLESLGIAATGSRSSARTVTNGRSRTWRSSGSARFRCRSTPR